MVPDSSPDDVGISTRVLSPVLEGRPAVRGPAELPSTLSRLYSMDSQARIELAFSEALDQARDGGQERTLLLRSQSPPLRIEAPGPLVCRHREPR